MNLFVCRLTLVSDTTDLNLAPKLPAPKEADMLKKKTYGKVPKYVTKIK